MVNNLRILILGSTGLIGRKLFSLLDLENHVFSTFHSKPFSGGFLVDVTSRVDLEKIFAQTKPNIVINLSAIYNNLDFCEENKDLVMSINGSSVETIAKLSNQYNSFLLHFSSDYVFDGKKGDYLETDIPNPINYFGKTKLQGENNVKKFAKNYCIVRTSMVYGVNDENTTLPDWILEQVMKNNPLDLINDQFMTPTYLDNLCYMILDVIKIKFSGVIHLAGPTKLSRFEFAEKLLKKLNKNLILKKISMTNFDKNNLRPKDSSLNTDLASKILDHKPENFEISVENYLKGKKLL